jgi:hypothetical protein
MPETEVVDELALPKNALLKAIRGCVATDPELPARINATFECTIWKKNGKPSVNLSYAELASTDSTPGDAVIISRVAARPSRTLGISRG